MNPPYHLESLLEQSAAGAALKYVFFWGHAPDKEGKVTKSCFSQWWPAEFEVNGVRYPTAEHYMMAEKARLFQDEVALARVLAARHPRDAKLAGRSVKGFCEEVWLRERFRIVVEASEAKFSQHPDLGRFLLGTGHRVLVEASPVDRIWGIGLAATEPGLENPSTWRGLNLLGFALMVARDSLPAA